MADTLQANAALGATIESRRELHGKGRDASL